MCSDTNVLNTGFAWQLSQQGQQEKDQDLQGAPVERVFLVPFGSIASKADILVDHTTSSRVDVFCRSVVAAVMCSCEIRKDSTFLAMLAKPSWTKRVGWALLDSMRGELPPSAGAAKIVKVAGAEIPKKRGALIPTERWISKTLSLVLDPPAAKKKAEERCVGWSAFEVGSLREFLMQLGLQPRHHGGDPPPRGLAPALRAYVLHGDASALLRDELERIADSKPERLIFIVGDHIGLQPYQVNYLVEEFGATAVRIGATPLLTSHCITILQHLVDEHWPARLVVQS